MHFISYLLALCAFFIVCSFFGLCQSEPPPISPAENAVNEILAAAAKKIGKKYNIRPAGVGAAMPGGNVKGFHLSFSTQASLTKEQLRKVVLESIDLLREEINQNESVRPYLVKYPFTNKEVSIVIFNYAKDGYDVFDPDISVAGWNGQMLSFDTKEPGKYGFKNTMEETPEEAQDLVKQMK